MKSQFDAMIRNEGKRDFEEIVRNWQRNIAGDEQYLAGIRARAMFGGDQDAWIKYRALMAARQVRGPFDHARLVQMLDTPPDRGPYEYSQHARDRLKHAGVQDRQHGRDARVTVESTVTRASGPCEVR